MNILTLETHHKEEILDITEKVQALLPAGVTQGWVYVYCPHTTAGIAVNEGSDPDVRRDFLVAIDHLITCETQFRHAEGNSKAHAASVLTGCGQWLLVMDGKLKLGRWQSIWFCEFDGPRKREVWVSVKSA